MRPLPIPHLLDGKDSDLMMTFKPAHCDYLFGTLCQSMVTTSGDSLCCHQDVLIDVKPDTYDLSQRTEGGITEEDPGQPKF